ncbi:MAG: hypothetical protein HYU66_12680, partial [Armatimonadetes bacterium]|nr:hypothetical protein [Armatimonadota bacterium]
ERGAPDGGEVVDADRIRSWLKLRPGERFTCRAGLLEARRIIASDAGLAIRDGRRRWFSGWCDLRDLELALADFECHTWRLVTEQGETRFDPWCRGAATLATAIEYALAEAAVGHPLPAAPDADLPRAPISKAGDDDHAGRGVSRP